MNYINLHVSHSKIHHERPARGLQLVEGRVHGGRVGHERAAEAAADERARGDVPRDLPEGLGVTAAARSVCLADWLCLVTGA